MALSEAEANMQTLSRNPYPGRVIAMGMMEDGRYVQVWGMTGRSDNSQNRRIVLLADGSLRTEALDPSKLKDPQNVIYTGMDVAKDYLYLVGNGDQVETAKKFIEDPAALGGYPFMYFQRGLATRRDEGPGTKHTLRETGIINTITGESMFYINTRATQNHEDPDRHLPAVYPVELMEGEGYYYRTYARPTDDLPTYRGQPIPIAFKGTIDEIAATWRGIFRGKYDVDWAVRAFGVRGENMEVRLKPDRLRRQAA